MSAPAHRLPRPMAPGATYALYGLRVRSDARLPCPEAPGPNHDRHDVELRECPGQDLARHAQGAIEFSDSDGFWDSVDYADGAAYVRWRGHFEFFICTGGTLVLWRRLVAVPDEVVFTYLLNQVLSYCLVARGLEPLHAACVSRDGRALAFAGDSGQGKSTLVAALLRSGLRLITDDALVLRFAGDAPIAHPGVPRLKLFPDTAAALFGDRSALPMNRFTAKSILPLAEAERAPGPARLQAIYLLDDEAGDEAPSIRHASGPQAMLALVQHSFHTPLLRRERIQRHFAFVARVARTVPIRILRHPRRLARLPQVAEAVVADFERESDAH